VAKGLWCCGRTIAAQPLGEKFALFERSHLGVGDYADVNFPALIP